METADGPASPHTADGSLFSTLSDQLRDPFTSTTGSTVSTLPTPIEVSHIISGRPPQPTTNAPSKLQSVVSPHDCGRSDCAMVKVLDTSELLEHILTFLPLTLISSLRLVDRDWRSLIDGSPTIRLHLFVVSRWNYPAANFQLLSLAIPGLEITRGPPVHLGNWVEIRMTLAAVKDIREGVERRQSPKRSARFFNDFECTMPEETLNSANSLLTQVKQADLMITQPPLRSMQVFLVDVDNADSAQNTPGTTVTGQGSKTIPPARSKISCDAGISLGCLADVAETLLRKNRFADNPEYYTGKVVAFRAIVSFCVQSDAAPRMRSTTRTVMRIK